jgi:hypothetical protein
MKEIHMIHGFTALVDDEDYEELSKHRWYCNDEYAIRRRKNGESGNTRNIKMHIAIMGKVEGLEIDHINGNKLDNQKSNLRHVTRSQNLCNMKPRGGSSRYKGVCWDSGTKKWRVQINDVGKVKYVGVYANESDAATAYNVAAEQLFGEYARLNVVESNEGVGKC